MDFYGVIARLVLFSSSCVLVTSEKPVDDYYADLLQRLQGTENLVLQLLERVDRQESEIANLKVQLSAEKQRRATLESIVRNFTPNRMTEDADQTTETQNFTDKSKSHQRIRRAENEVTVAFFATITQNVGHAGVDQVLVFDHVITNLGHAYSSHTGTFFAPVSGTYVFSGTLMSVYHTNDHFEFRKNGQFLSRLYVSGSEAGYDTTSQTIVVQLQKGDGINIHNIDNDASFAGGHFSSFAGFLLQEDLGTSSVVVGK